MSQRVIVVRNDMNGLFIKKTGTFGAGAKWQIDEVPEGIIRKAQEKITFKDIKTGYDVRAISFMTTSGNWIGIEDAYIERFSIGKKPTDPEVHEYVKSAKDRKIKKKDVELSEEDDLNDEEGDGSSETPEVEEVEADESEESGETVIKKKKKKIRG